MGEKRVRNWENKRGTGIEKKNKTTINPSYLKRLIRVFRSCILCMVSGKSRLNCVCTTCGPKHLFQVKQSYTTFGCINQTANILTGEFLYKGFLVINQPAKEVADFARSPFPFLGKWREKKTPRKKFPAPISFHVECHCWYEIFFLLLYFCCFFPFRYRPQSWGKSYFHFFRIFFVLFMKKESGRRISAGELYWNYYVYSVFTWLDIELFPKNVDYILTGSTCQI